MRRMKRFFVQKPKQMHKPLFFHLGFEHRKTLNGTPHTEQAAQSTLMPMRASAPGSLHT